MSHFFEIEATWRWWTTAYKGAFQEQATIRVHVVNGQALLFLPGATDPLRIKEEKSVDITIRLGGG